MPLDTGAAPNRSSAPFRADASALDRLRPIRLTLAVEGGLGAALREARETLGLEAVDISQATRIRAPQILALESDDFAALPPRPFVVGFVRSYARALGVDAEAAVARLAMQWPVAPPALRRPAGLRHVDQPRRGRWIALTTASLIGAVLAWNLVQHAAARPRQPRSGVRLAPAAPARLSGITRLGAPLPPPPEASAPPTYATPGVDPEPFGVAPPSTPEGLASDASAQDQEAGAVFQPAGVIFGDIGAASLILQARKPTTLVVRDAKGGVTFARQLAAGQAWRAPANLDLTIEVGNPRSVERFVDGRSRGSLSAARGRLADLRG